MTLPLVLDTNSSPLETQFAPVLTEAARAKTAVGQREDVPRVTPQSSIFALHLVSGEVNSRIERVQDLLARRLPQFGCEVGFACVKPQRFSVAREWKAAPLVEMPMRGWFDLRVVKRIAELVRSEDYDLIHAHMPRVALVARLAARRAGVPFVYHIHSRSQRDSNRKLFNWLNATAESAVIRGADRIIAVSPSVQHSMIGRGIPADRIVCVPNGVPVMYSQTERRPATAAWTLGAIAFFRPRQGIEVLLEAMAVLKSRNVNVRLRAVGGFESPAYKADVLGLASRLDLTDSIDWIGFTRNVNREFAKINLLMLPSLVGDGLPTVVLEAMAAGLPVVASRVEGVPDAVLHRSTGLLVEPGSVSQLAAAIEEVVSGGLDYEALSRAARRRHAELFSDTTMATGVARVYREVLAKTKSK